ncbi:M42 family metallopeptidase [Kamptonema cortianum]|nr:M42 family metallopeptidase [Geitlerinema splendidum]MDK3161200.1 M42 family metallopeptidase [Kamptonema cortianum]
MRAESLDFLRTLCNTPSPSGYEERAAQVYRDYTSKFADEVKTDIHGNTWAVLNPKAEMKVMLAGHIDEIGFQIHHIDEKGFLYFRGIGGHDSMVPLGNRVWVHGTEQLAGVIGRKPIHLLESGEKDKRPELHDLWIDIGASSREEAAKYVSIGDVATYQFEFAKVLGGRAVARGFDNRVGSFAVAEALRLLKEKGGLHKDVGVYAVATVQEEIGLRGARTSAHAIGAQSGLAVDVDFAIDHPGVSQTRYGTTDIGKGPSITRGANINPIVFSMLKEAAKKERVSVQIAAEPGGTGTDANAMQIAATGMATGLCGIPLRYMHSPCELLSLQDVDDCAKLMAGYCKLVKPTTDFTPRVLK